MLDLLRRELGAHGIVADETRWTIDGRAPIAVVQPGNTEQVAAVLEQCTKEGFAVEAAGAGSWLNRGTSYDRDYIVLSTARMDEVIAYEPEDLTIGVQAGMPLNRLQQIVAKNRQQVALDPPAHADATIGAVAALASAGPLRCMYGTPRDHVLGLDVVTGDGRVLQVGGRVVKNVAGYDVTRLLVGSHGTLAVITRVNLKLRPRAQHDITWLITANDTTPLLEIAAHLYNAPFEPAAVELVRDVGSWKLLVRVHCNDEAAQHARAVIHAAAGAIGTGNSASAARASNIIEIDSERGPVLWSELLAREAAPKVYIRLSHLPAKLPQLITMAAAAFPDALIAAHVYDGVVRVSADSTGVMSASNAQHERLREFRDQVISEGGSISLPVLPAGSGRDLPRHGPIGNELKLMQGVKRALDPAGVLAPGRFVL